MPVNWALGLQQSNAGDAFATAFKQGQTDNRASMARSAMARLVQNPSDAGALAALAKTDPERAMEFRKTQLQYGDKSHEEWAKTIGLAAKQATTPQMWDQIVDHFVAEGHPEAARLKGQFSPALRAAFMSQGGVQDDNQNSQLVPFTEGGGVARMNPQTHQLETLVMPNPGGHQAGSPAGNLPQVGDQQSYDAVPPGGQYLGPDGHVRVKGGQAGQPSPGGF